MLLSCFNSPAGYFTQTCCFGFLTTGGLPEPCRWCEVVCVSGGGGGSVLCKPRPRLRLRVGQESCRTVTPGLRDVARRDPVMMIVHEKAVLSTALGSSYSPTSSTSSQQLCRRIFAVSIVHSLPAGASQNRAWKYKIITDYQSWVYWKWHRPQNVDYSTSEQYLREAALEARHCMAMRHCSLGEWAGGVASTPRLWELCDFVMKQHISNEMDARQDFILQLHQSCQG